ncbi:hypothetical protein KRR26_17900 [Corallococcus sp. M34]|uniref:hypothetical protein n=1 Tax=Citreicoccus inhibens TaxID=2849499 RepID=UPI001C21B5D6|nr:hypothetical protein [Citreicoccus inhibens]MBU8897495.1 hypothetical protein [Citreicoccus inhibens]
MFDLILKLPYEVQQLILSYLAPRDHAALAIAIEGTQGEDNDQRIEAFLHPGPARRIRAPPRMDGAFINFLLGGLSTGFMNLRDFPELRQALRLLTGDAHMAFSGFYRLCVDRQAELERGGALPFSTAVARWLPRSAMHRKLSGTVTRSFQTTGGGGDRPAFRGGTALERLFVGHGDLTSWVDALILLTQYRKRMFWTNLQENAGLSHVNRGGTSYHTFTQLFLAEPDRTIPSCVWFHNDKSSDGGGATRVVSFYDTQNGTLLVTTPKFIAGHLDAMEILDASYEEVYQMLRLMRRLPPFCNGDPDVLLATYLLSFLNGNVGTALRRQPGLNGTLCLRRAKVKKLLNTRAFRIADVTLTIDQACLTALSILFLTEPRHAMPLWTSNYDALCCIAEGTLTFDDIFGCPMIFDASSGVLMLQHDDEGSIGRLLSSNNTAATYTDPSVRHTRKLKELIMPVTELFIKHGMFNVIAQLTPLLVSEMTEYRRVNEIDSDLPPSLPWYDPISDATRDLSYEKEQPWSGKGRKPKPLKMVPPGWDGVLPNKETRKKSNAVVRSMGSTLDSWGQEHHVSRRQQERFSQARQLTVLAPVLKILLLRLLRGRNALLLEKLLMLARQMSE